MVWMYVILYVAGTTLNTRIKSMEFRYKFQIMNIDWLIQQSFLTRGASASN